MRINFIGLTLTRTKNIDPELRFSEFFRNIIQESDLVIDVGANKGQFIKKLIDINYKNNIIAVEPTNEAFEYLKSKYKKLPKIEFLKTAIGSQRKILEINVASNNAESSSVLEFTKWHSTGAPSITMKSKEKIRQVTLKSIIDKTKNRAIFIKVDVQGYELEVLKGIGNKNWPRIKGMIVEVNLVETYKNAPLIEEVLDFMRKKNFRPLRIEPGFGLANFGQQLQADILFVRN
jgi:FkbM family methyltransferase